MAESPDNPPLVPNKNGIVTIGHDELQRLRAKQRPVAGIRSEAEACLATEELIFRVKANWLVPTDLAERRRVAYQMYLRHKARQEAQKSAEARRMVEELFRRISGG